MKNIIYLIPFLLTATWSQAQEVKVISKQEVIDQVEANNATIKISEHKVKSVEGEYRQTNALFLPTIGVSHTGVTTTNPLMAFGSKLNQGIIAQSDFNPDLLNNPDRVDNFSTRVDVSQPLVNVDGLYQRKAAKAKLNATVLQTSLIKDQVVLSVEEAYMQLQLAYKTASVVKAIEVTVKENLRLAENNLEQGYIQKADLMLVKIRMAEVQNQWLTAQSRIENVSNKLTVLMGDTSNQILVPSDSLEVNSKQIVGATLPRNRADILAMNYVQQAKEQMYKSSKMSFMPRLNAFGFYEINDQDAFSGNVDGYLVGAKLSWNLFEGSRRFGATQMRKAQMNQSKVEYENYLANSELELRKTQRSFEDSKRTIETTNLIVEQAKEALRIRVNRYEQGVENTADLLNAEAQFAQAQLNQAMAIFQHNALLNYLEFLTNE